MNFNFAYPFFDKATSIILNDIGTSNKDVYPSDASYEVLSLSDENIILHKEKTSVVVIRDNIGYDCKWSYVRTIGNEKQEDNGKEFYILTSNLLPLSTKKSYFVQENGRQDPYKKHEYPTPIREQEVNKVFPNYRDGVYSVRIQVDYEKILDIGIFKTVMKEAYYAGVSQILIFTGKFKSDASIYRKSDFINGEMGAEFLPPSGRISNEKIDELETLYNTFAYVEKDFDETTRTICDNITFTISIPFNFFTQFEQPVVVPPVDDSADMVLKFNNSDFFEHINTILNVITTMGPKVLDALFPNKVAVNYITDAELLSLKKFAIDFNNVLNFFVVGGLRSSELVNLELGFKIKEGEYIPKINKYTETLELKYFKYNNNFVNQSIVQTLRLREFNNSRIFNYLINIENLERRFRSGDLTVDEYFSDYVRFPRAYLDESGVKIGDIEYTSKEIADIRIYNEKKSQSCINLSDVLGAAGDAVSFADDVKYHWATLKDPLREEREADQKNSTDIRKKLQGAEDILKGTYTDGASKVNLGMDLFAAPFVSSVRDPLMEGFSSLKTAGNTLFYVASRIDAQQLLMKKLICLLKGADPNDGRIIEILKNLPEQLINFFYYLDNLSRLTNDPLKFTEALLYGFPFDFELGCSDEAAYFIKNFRTFVQFLGGTLTSTLKTIEFIKTEDAYIRQATDKIIGTKQINNPWRLVLNSLGKTFWRQIIDFIFDQVKFLLTEECDDSAYKTSPEEYQSPFDTHFPYMSGQEKINDNEEKKQENIRQALEESIPELILKMSYGSDLDYTINILDLLIRDLKCLVTPLGTINLLKGTPNAEDIIIIRNLIKTKYSNPTNDLRFLLFGENIMMFFKKLGKYVDPLAIKKLEEFAFPEYSNNVCEPEITYARQQLIKNKLPPELDVLRDANERRIARINEVLRRMKEQNKVIVFSALCPEIEDADVLAARREIIEDQKTTARGLFQQILESFDREMSEYPSAFFKEQTFYRQNIEESFYETIEYGTYQANLYRNLTDLGNFYSIPTQNNNMRYFVAPSSTNMGTIQKYAIKDQVFDSSKLSNLLNTNKNLVNDDGYCVDLNEDNNFLNNLLKSGRIIVTDAIVTTEDFDKAESGIFYQLNNHESRRRYFKNSINEDKNDSSLDEKADIDFEWAMQIYRACAYHEDMGNNLVGYTKEQLIKLVYMSAVDSRNEYKEDRLWGFTWLIGPLFIKDAKGELESIQEFVSDIINNRRTTVEDIDVIFPPVQGAKYTVKELYKSVKDECMAYTSNFSKFIDPSIEAYIKEKGYAIISFINRGTSYFNAGEGNATLDTVSAGLAVPRIVYTVMAIFYDDQFGDFRSYELFKENVYDISKTASDTNGGKSYEENQKRDDYRSINNFINNIYQNYFFNDNKTEEISFKTELVEKLGNRFWNRGAKHHSYDNQSDKYYIKNKYLFGKEHWPEEGVVAPLKNILPVDYGEKINQKYIPEIEGYKNDFQHVYTVGRSSRAVVASRKKIIDTPDKAATWIPVSYDAYYNTLYENTNFRVFGALGALVRRHESNIKEILQNKKTFESLYSLSKAFDEGGIFNITSSYYAGSLTGFNCKKTVRVGSAATTPPDSTTIPIVYKDYYTLEYKIQGVKEDIAAVVKNTFPTYIASLISIGNYVEDISYVSKIGKSEYKDYWLKPSFDDGEIMLIDNSEKNWWEFFALQFGGNIEIKSFKSAEEVINLSENKNYTATKPIDYVDYAGLNYNKIKTLVISTPDALGSSLKCSYKPHYLNLEHLLRCASDYSDVNLCDENMPDMFAYLMEEVIAILTIRVYVTDFLIKLLPLLNIMDEPGLRSISSEDYPVDIFVEHLKKELNKFTENVPEDSEKSYYNLLSKKCLEVAMRKGIPNLFEREPVDENVGFDSDRSRQSSIQSAALSLTNDTAQDTQQRNLDMRKSAVKHFIKKEMQRFIKIALDRRLVMPASTSAWDLYGNNLTRNQRHILRHEFYSLFIYFLMHSTVNVSIYTALSQTKTILAEKFFETIKIERSMSNGEQEEIDDLEEISQNDIIKTILDASYSPNPAVLMLAKRDWRYQKYIKFFISESLANTREILLQTARATDFNIKQTRLINFGLATATSLAYSFWDKKERDDYLIQLLRKTDFTKPGFDMSRGFNIQQMLQMKRAEAGKSPLDDLPVSLISAAAQAGWPTQAGWGYLLIDFLKQQEWTGNTLSELLTLKNSLPMPPEGSNINPCEYIPDELCVDPMEKYDEPCEEPKKIRRVVNPPCPPGQRCEEDFPEPPPEGTPLDCFETGDCIEQLPPTEPLPPNEPDDSSGYDCPGGSDCYDDNKPEDSKPEPCEDDDLTM